MRRVVGTRRMVDRLRILVVGALAWIVCPPPAFPVDAAADVLAADASSRPVLQDKWIGADAAYGLPFGASEAEAVRRFGKPIGIIQLGEPRRALLYGRSHSLIFKHGRLQRLVIDSFGSLPRLDDVLAVDPQFDGDQWQLRPGIAPDMTPREIGDVLGVAIPDGHRWSYVADGAEIDLTFVARGDGAGKREYFLSGVTITHLDDAPGAGDAGQPHRPFDGLAKDSEATNPALPVCENGAASAESGWKTSPSPPETEGEPANITADFDDVAVVVLAMFFEQLTGRRHVVESGETESLDLKIVNPVTVGEAHARFVTVLEAGGFRVLDEGSEITISRVGTD